MQKNISEMTVEQLFEQYRSDVLRDTRSFTERVNKSEAQKELVARGRPTLGQLAMLIRREAQSMTIFHKEMRLDTALGMLMYFIGLEVDRGIAMNGPKLYADLIGWAEWAERYKYPTSCGRSENGGKNG